MKPVSAMIYCKMLLKYLCLIKKISKHQREVNQPKCHLLGLYGQKALQVNVKVSSSLEEDL